MRPDTITCATCLASVPVLPPRRTPKYCGPTCRQSQAPGARRSRPSSVGHPALGYVYTLRDADGRALYIGVTNHPVRRFAVHARRDFWPRVESVDIAVFGSREAYQAEFWAIYRQRPVHNKACPRWMHADFYPDPAPIATHSGALRPRPLEGCP